MKHSTDGYVDPRLGDLPSKTYGPSCLQDNLSVALSSLRKRIRSPGFSPAKMENRAFQSYMWSGGLRAIFRDRIVERRSTIRASVNHPQIL